MKNKLSIIKIGGNIIDDDIALYRFLKDFAALKEDKILIHGGGRAATRISSQLGIATRMIDGRRVTSKENLDVVTMVYAGLINKKIVAGLQSFACNAIGLSGIDANCILSSKRDSAPVDFGWVGDIEKVNVESVKHFLSGNMTPVFCSISHDINGQILNINADTVAAEIAIALSREYETQLIYCFEKNGVLSDIHDDDSVITSINPTKYEALKAAGNIDEGMIPKMENCFRSLRNNVSKVTIGNTGMLNNNKLYTTVTL